MKQRAYIGHYTDERHIGIRQIEADDETGRFTVVRTTTIDNSTWLVQSADGRWLYAVCNDPSFGPPHRDGGLAVFNVADDGALTPLDVTAGDVSDVADATKTAGGAADAAKAAGGIRAARVATDFTAPCHACLSADGRTLAWAEYSCATLGAVDLDETGAFLPGTRRVLRHEGTTGPHPRQATPHAHCVQVTPDGKYLCVVDLGLDAVRLYEFTHGAAGLRPLPEKTLKTAPAFGPRHIVFHPNGKLAFLIAELGNRVTSYRYADGTFTAVSDLSTLPDGFTGTTKAAAIKISEDGTELYCSNRGHDSLAVFSLDPATGALARRAVLPLGGAFPRDFAFFPGGKFLLACLKMSNTIRTYAYDRAACTLTPVCDLMEADGVYRPLFAAFAV